MRSENFKFWTFMSGCTIASWRIVACFAWCSIHPGVAVINAFCTDLSKYLLSNMKQDHLFFRMVVNSFPTQEVRAMGLKYI